MAIVVFLRGANVGGHRRFRPSLLAKELQDFDVVNVGATGLFVVRNPGSTRAFRSELVRRLPFDTRIVACEGADLLALESCSPFQEITVAPDHVRFVSILTGAIREPLPAMPFGIPSNDDWYVRIVGRRNEFVFGIYRRHMKTISYLGQIDKALLTPVTTRNWSTIDAVLKILKR
ncbi:MAG TPA: hypothetical protein VFE16_00925 [Candidatus Cybelea sp.]|jgi:uncharacterized protein (DUF1697 family)|nr:hypothetical protein [Candidatus Cybelea sp.]